MRLINMYYVIKAHCINSMNPQEFLTNHIPLFPGWKHKQDLSSTFKVMHILRDVTSILFVGFKSVLSMLNGNKQTVQFFTTVTPEPHTLQAP